MINPRVHHSVAETLEAMRGYTDALKHERLSHAGCAMSCNLIDGTAGRGERDARVCCAIYSVQGELIHICFTIPLTT